MTTFDLECMNDLERIATSKIFPWSIEIAATTPSVDEKRFLCHVPSTETPTSVVGSVPRSIAAASGIVFSATCLDATLIE